MNRFTVNASTIRAALRCAAKDSTRYNLNGVLFRQRADDVLAFATDGHRLCVIRDKRPAGGEPYAPGDVLIRRDYLTGLKTSTKWPRVEISYEPGATADSVVQGTIAGLKDGDRLFKSIDARYPDFDRVIPRKVSGEREVKVRGSASASFETLSFDPAFLADFEIMAKELGAKVGVCDVYWNGPAGAVVLCASVPNLLGVVMPRRMNAPAPFALPSWYQISEDQQ